MARSEPEYLVVGQLNKVHGTSGELYVWPLTDHPESSFAPGVMLYLGDETGAESGVSGATLVVTAVRPFQKGFLVRFQDITSRNQAQEVRGRYLLRPLSELEELAEGEIFYHQLLGMEVRTVEGEEVGRVVEVYELQPADLLAVRGPRGLRHIPMLKNVVREVDVEGRRLVIDPPDGLLDL